MGQPRFGRLKETLDAQMQQVTSMFTEVEKTSFADPDDTNDSSIIKLEEQIVVASIKDPDKNLSNDERASCSGDSTTNSVRTPKELLASKSKGKRHSVRSLSPAEDVSTPTKTRDRTKEPDVKKLKVEKKSAIDIPTTKGNIENKNMKRKSVVECGEDLETGDVAGCSKESKRVRRLSSRGSVPKGEESHIEETSPICITVREDKTSPIKNSTRNKRSSTDTPKIGKNSKKPKVTQRQRQTKSLTAKITCLTPIPEDEVLPSRTQRNGGSKLRKVTTGSGRRRSVKAAEKEPITSPVASRLRRKSISKKS